MTARSHPMTLKLALTVENNCYCNTQYVLAEIRSDRTVSWPKELSVCG